MDWQMTREQWNREGKCAIQACQGELHRRGCHAGRHPTTQLLYCIRCTRRLEEAQNITMERVPAPTPT